MSRPLPYERKPYRAPDDRAQLDHRAFVARMIVNGHKGYEPTQCDGEIEHRGTVEYDDAGRRFVDWDGDPLHITVFCTKCPGFRVSVETPYKRALREERATGRTTDQTDRQETPWWKD